MQTMGFIKVQRCIGMCFSAYLASYILSLICVAAFTFRIPASRVLAARVKIRWHSNQLSGEKKRRGAQTASGASLAGVVSDVGAICTTQLRARCRFANYKPRRTRLERSVEGIVEKTEVENNSREG